MVRILAPSLLLAGVASSQEVASGKTLVTFLDKSIRASSVSKRDIRSLPGLLQSSANGRRLQEDGDKLSHCIWRPAL